MFLVISLSKSNHEYFHLVWFMVIQKPLVMVKGKPMKNLDDVMVKGKPRKTLNMMYWLRVTHRKPMRWLRVSQRNP
jgi:hypothetical protein